MTATVIAGRGIVTPQGVVLDLETAGIGHRAVSRALDMLIIIAVGAGIFALSGLLPETAGFVFVLVVGFLWGFGYSIVSETFFRGRTVGKMVVGLRVVTLEAGPVGFRESFIRSLFQIVDILASLGSVALLTAMFTPRSQRLGDLAAGTFVIVDPRVLTHAPAVPFTPPMGTEVIVAEMDVSKLRPEQERVIRSFLLRIADLSPAARFDFGFRLAQSISRYLGHPDQYGLPPETYLVAVMAARQLREGGLAQLAIH